jgi:ABC-2 type transport system permease protein
MLNLIHAEFYKLVKSTGFRVCVLLSSICAVSLITIAHALAAGNMSAANTGNASGLTELMIISLLGSFMAGSLICGDFETKTIHDAVVCGKGRISVVICKTFVYVIIIAVLLLPYILTTIVAVSTGAKFTTPFVASTFIGILFDASQSSITAVSAGKIATVCLVTILVQAARLSLCIPLAFKVRKPVVVMGVGFAINGLIDFIISLINEIDLINKLLSVTPYSRDYVILGLNTGSDILIKAAGSSILFLIIMAGISYLLFKKAEIK